MNTTFEQNGVRGLDTTSLARRLELIHEQGAAPKTLPFCELVRNVVIIASSSRGGSSVFAELLRRCPEFLHLRAEMNPILHISGLIYPTSGSDSDALDAGHLTADIKTLLDRELRLECGNPYLGPLSQEAIDDYVLAITRRLCLQWPEFNFRYESMKRYLLATFDTLKKSFAWTASEVRDVQLFWIVFLTLIRKEFPQINPYYYDLDAELIHKYFPNLPIPEGPPSAHFIEEPPFIVPVPLKQASDSEIMQKPFVIKTPSNVYRLDFLKALFPNARPLILHLTRSAPQSINGLYDGWCHRGFFSYALADRLQIEGYSDRFPKWGKTWWNFDLPPGWQDYTKRSLVDVCAFQWYAAHRAICEDRKKHPLSPYLRMRSEDVLSASEDTRRATAEKLASCLDLVAGNSLTKTLQDGIAPVMATHPPQKNRWLAKSAIISPVLRQKEVQTMLEELAYTSADFTN